MVRLKPDTTYGGGRVGVVRYVVSAFRRTYSGGACEYQSVMRS